MNKIYLFNKEKFARTVMKIYLQYNNQREFAKRSGICRTYLSQYMNEKLDVPPKPEILQRLANTSKGLTTYQELMEICGYLEENETMNTKNKINLRQILKLINGLTMQEANYLIKQLKKAKIQIEKQVNK
ncbi:MAG: helix-turn-helix transcriptional regulator [Clostridia bacterium]|nr:helix-turn-helix transcriptional regulator [Clostridia bacterium]